MKKQEPLNIILLGDPASGKGVQATRLIKKYHLYDFDMGREVRKPAVRAGYDYAQTTAVGKLTPTSVARDILRRVIKSVPKNKGILFNGHPKMIGEAYIVASLLKKYKRLSPLVFYLSIPMHETLRRAAKRKREDDAEQALKNRHRYYKNQVSRVVAFFKKRYAFRNISGVGNRAEVEARIASAIKQYLKHHI